ncbi:uncharacterized protein P174DRAFT_430536 [Aspergillus novofumigatus IBT 16806]|uniref:Uncharacterized protein n=1 Tax=Aspergillus novofumigatus (strain IBT 16806) TaxID=1392255 RepID=A0A2I1C7E1_ASPN1|nr:uncharacterized protein P174DRAFT_430536 [Aspergillus novofumigatus IBT 16806]PKX93533.1 hypothetical protein P174DRAFT_430536 [Aspergillus novofumigatus IBT 16806]
MAPRWPKVNDSPEHIDEHATYLREACNQLQAPYLASTLALIGRVLRQPVMDEILQHVQDAAKCTQNIQNDITVTKNSVGLSTTPINPANFSGGRRNAAATWAQVAAPAKGAPAFPRLHHKECTPPRPKPQLQHTRTVFLHSPQGSGQAIPAPVRPFKSLDPSDLIAPPPGS